MATHRSQIRTLPDRRQRDALLRLAQQHEELRQGPHKLVVLIPFLEEHIRKAACSHWWSGTWDDSKMVPTFTVNWFLH